MYFYIVATRNLDKNSRTFSLSFQYFCVKSSTSKKKKTRRKKKLTKLYKNGLYYDNNILKYWKRIRGTFIKVGGGIKEAYIHCDNINFSNING